MDENKDAPLQPDQKDGEGEDTKPKEPADNLTPDHPRFQQVIKEKNDLKKEVEDLKEELEEVKESISARQERTGDEELTEEEKESLLKIDKELKKRGYVTKDQLEENQRIDRMANAFAYLSDQHDGTDGYPKFVAEDVGAYAEEHGYPLSRPGFEAAYRAMHFDAIVKVEAGKANAPTPPSSEKPTGAERQVTGEFTPEQIANMSDEEFAKNEEKIMSTFKKSVTGR